MSSIITAKNLSKSFKSYKKEPGLLGSIKSLYNRDYQEKYAVDAFDIKVKQNQIIGLLGPNGAGKTTLMKMFTGIIVPSSGELEILGHEPSKRDKNFRKKMALVMGQKSQLWWDIPAMDSFELLQRYYEIDSQSFKNKIKKMSKLLEVENLLHVHVRKLSLGERMKLELMASLLHEPEIIFLDEPTIGLDLVAQENIREFIKDYHKTYSSTIVITSHYMTDVQELCDRLVFIADGKKSFDGPLSDFSNILGRDKIVAFSINSENAPVFNQEFTDLYHPTWDAKKKTIELKVPEQNLKKISLYMFNHFDITDFQTEKMPIERVMKTIMANPALLSK